MNLPATTADEMIALPAFARSQVYFAQDFASLRVKIGHSANLGARIAGLEKTAGIPLNLIRAIDGGRATERWLHRRFAARRRIGEWFDYHPDMLTVVPPDEIIRPQQVVVRRDVLLTIRERLRNADELGMQVGLRAKHALLAFVTDLTDDEAEAIINIIRERY